jgi:alginate O-acetyltransferase complex protein AlgJ
MNDRYHNKPESIILIIIFLAAIFLPASMMNASLQKEISQIEKRNLALFPDLKMELESIIQFPVEFEAFFKDHFGFRENLIFLHNKMKFNLFKTSTSPRVIIGKDGWLFYKKDEFGISLLDHYRGLHRLTNLQLEAMRIHLETKQDWLSEKGIKYLFVVVPDKHSIYPEYMPDHLNRISKISLLDQFVEYMGRNSSLRILDLRSELLKEKNRYLLYFRTDLHWNDAGAYYAYCSVMRRIKESFPELQLIDWSELKITLNRHSAKNLSKMMGLPEISEDGIPSFIKIIDNTSVNNSPGWKMERWPRWLQPLETINHKAKLRAVVFRDSFMDDMRPFISEHFNKAAYIGSKFDYEVMTHLIDEIQPDIVIEEGVECHTFLEVLPEVIHATMGNDYLMKGDTDKAIVEFQKALQQRPDDPKSYNNLGFALLKVRKFDTALTQFQKAIQLDPNHEKANQNLRFIKNILSKIDEEITCTKQNLASNPDNPELHIILGRLYQRRGMPDKAIEHFRKVLVTHPKHFEAILNMAILFSNMQQYEKAITLFKQALDLQPEKADIYYNIACLYSLKNNSQKSVQWLRTAIEKGYNNLDLIREDADLANIRNTQYYRSLFVN